MAKYYALVTDKGMALYTNAGLVGAKVNITEFAVGDGGGNYYQPEPGMTALRHEVWRGAVTEYELDAESNFMANIYAVIPAQVGGFTIREMAAFDAAGNMVAIANTPDCLKAAMSDGVSSDMELCISVIMEHPEHGESNVDPDTVIVSRRYLEKATGTPRGPASFEQGVTPAERAAITDNTAARHAHDNRSVLDTIIPALLDKWNAAYTHVSDAVKHITAAERTDWNAKADKTYVDASLADWTFTAADVGAVPAARKVNGKALSADITLAKGDVGLGSVDNTADSAKRVLYAATAGSAAANGGTAAACSGNAATATQLQTARTINGVAFNGSANITVTAAANGGNAATATKLQTARKINGVAFDGTGDIAVSASPTAHNHDAGNITAGILPLGRGGTGNTTGNASACNSLTFVVASAAPSAVTNNRVTFSYG